ncbi:MAG TPA: transglycosylase SLT domain-containing protein [Thermoanaerobaculia bacterium]|nr:transglycosylase SLT domain-containing protein [Thermoanaerobaculia bacterium]
MPLNRLAAAFFVGILAARIAAADAGALDAAPVDVDTDFAHAADLLEAGQRAEAERILEEIRSRKNQPAWDARVALLLAADDFRRHDYSAAADRLATPASSIGLDAYRELARAEALELAGRRDEAIASARRAFQAEGSFAYRVRAAVVLARLLEQQGAHRDAAEVLALAAAAASTRSETAEVAVARMRVGLSLHDRRIALEAARTMLLEAPTADADRKLPAFVRAECAEAERSLAPAERGRRGAALVAAGDPRRGVRLLSQNPPSAWPEGERAQNLLALARGQLALKKPRDAEATAARVPDDGTVASAEARLLRCDLVVARVKARSKGPAPEQELEPVVRALEDLASPAQPSSVRRAAEERLLRLAADDDDFDRALARARALTEDAPGTTDGFEPLWLVAWRMYLAGDYAGARTRFEALAALYADVSRSRRLTYWRARCLAAEGKTDEARSIFASLASARPADIYARFAQKRAATTPAAERPPVGDPSTATAAFARVDELLRLRRFEESVAEARSLPPSRGRDLRLAQAEFALGRFSTAALAIKRALPEIGTADEGRVPETWRRFYYPIEEGGTLATRAKQFDLDAALLRGLVRQESVFDTHVKSHAGAVGLMQLMPSTARSLSRSVLHTRYRGGFLYDPDVNAALGAAYLKRLVDRFDGSTVLGLAAYNGGPSRIARLARDNPRLSEDELFESIPIYETRDYVRRVLLYADSYRELYP